MNEKSFNDVGNDFFEKRKKEEKKLTRRAFLKAGLALGVSSAVSSFLKDKITNYSNPKGSAETETKGGEVDKRENNLHEEKAIVTTPLEQLHAYGEIKDLKSGIKILFDDHYRYFVMTEKGKKDVETAIYNLSKLNMSEIINMYRARQLPEELAYMIAIQETRGVAKKSSAGARGITGIMPSTARAMGYSVEDVSDPYIANKITAEYLTNERNKRFGNDVDLLLHAYNAGGRLFGFTKKTTKEERTLKNFYTYMQNYINSIYKEVKEKGYYEHTIDDKDKTLTHISKRFNVSLRDILEENNLDENSPIHVGDKIKIPYHDMENASKILFRKPFEALNYVPEIKAKYKAIRDLGLLRKIGFSESKSSSDFLDFNV